MVGGVKGNQRGLSNMLQRLEKEKSYTIGFLQAAGVAAYCGFIAWLFSFLTTNLSKPGFYGFFILLLLFVFSAAVTGTLVFGFSSYLCLVKKKVRKATEIIFYTLLFFVLIIGVSITLIVNLL